MDAYFDLGVCYKRGKGMEMYHKKAKDCYQKAIDDGNGEVSNHGFDK